MGWFVLHVGSRTEKKVAAVCARHGLPHYLPLREDVRVYQRRKVVIQRPLFQGYLFADLVPDSRAYVMRTNHVLQLIPPADEQRLVYELDQIRQALAADPRLSSEPKLCRGMRVRITSGVFAGIEGVVDVLSKRTVVRLNVALVGQSVAVEVERDFVACSEDRRE